MKSELCELVLLIFYEMCPPLCYLYYLLHLSTVVNLTICKRINDRDSSLQFLLHIKAAI